MTAVSTPVSGAVARPNIARLALVAIAIVVIVAALAFVLVNALAGASQPTAGYDAPYYTEYLQDMAHGW
jgi:hypothetical protein